MIASDIIKRRIPKANGLYIDTRYINYLIYTAIGNKKNTFELIASHIKNNIDATVYLDEEALRFYLNTNFDFDGKERYLFFEKDKNNYDMFHRMTKKIDDISDLSDELLLKNIKEKYNLDYANAIINMIVYLKNISKEKYSNLFLYSLCFDLMINHSQYEKKFNEIKRKNNVVEKEDILTDLYDKSESDISILSMLVTYSNKYEKKMLKEFNVVTLEDLLINNYNLFSIIFCIEINEYLELLSNMDSDKIKNIYKRLNDYYSSFGDNQIIVFKTRFKTIGSDKILTLQEVGDSVSLTRERVRQIEAKINREIKNMRINIDDLIPLMKYIDLKNYSYISNEKFIKTINNNILSKLIKIKISLNNNFNINFSDEYDTFYFKEKNIDEIVEEFNKKLPSVIVEEKYKKMTYIEKVLVDKNYKLTKKGYYIKKGYRESDTYLELLDLYFPEGYRINNDDDYNFLMEKYTNLYKTENAPTSSRYIATKLERNEDYCIIDRGLYLRRDKCPKLPENLKEKLIDYIKNSSLVVYYSELYELFKFELNVNDINNQFLLKGLLDYELNSDFHTSRDFITYGNQQNKWDAIINYMKSFNNIFTLDELYNEFPGVSYTIFQGIIASESEKGLLILYNKRFIYVDKTNIGLIKGKLKEKIEYLFQSMNTNYLTSHKIFAKIALSNDNFLNKVNFEVDGFNMYSIIRNLFPNDYYYRRPIISKLDAGIMTNIMALRQYLVTLDEFDIKGVEKHVTKMGLSNKWYYEFYSLCEYMSEEFVLVDKKTMVKKSKLAVDDYTVDEIERNINSLFDRYDEIDLTEFDAYFIFPDIKGYEWNQYLLIGLINTYMLDKFEIRREGTNFYIRRINNEL